MNEYEFWTGLLFVVTYVATFVCVALAPLTVRNSFKLWRRNATKRVVNQWKGFVSTRNIEFVTGNFYHDHWNAWTYGITQVESTADVEQKLRNSKLPDVADGLSTLPAEAHERNSNAVPVEGFPVSRLWAVPNERT